MIEQSCSRYTACGLLQKHWVCRCFCQGVVSRLCDDGRCNTECLGNLETKELHIWHEARVLAGCVHGAQLTTRTRGGWRLAIHLRVSMYVEPMDSQRAFRHSFLSVAFSRGMETRVLFLHQGRWQEYRVGISVLDAPANLGITVLLNTLLLVLLEVITLLTVLLNALCSRRFPLPV